MIVGFVCGVVFTLVVVYFLKIFKDGEQFDAEIAREIFEQKQKYCEHLEQRNLELERQIKILETALDESRKIIQREY